LIAHHKKMTFFVSLVYTNVNKTEILND